MGCVVGKQPAQPKDSLEDECTTKEEIPSWRVDEYLTNHPEIVEKYVKKHSSQFQDLHHVLNVQRTLNEFMLDLVQSIFNDMLSIDVVVQKIIAYAPKLVGADRASLFLVDSNTNELYARIYNSKTVSSQADEQQSDRSWTEIRFKIGKGIGACALTGETLNIPDAYADERFNPEVDNETGYKTKAILCMPVFIHGTVMGVVQMVNKKNGETFNVDDVRGFESFSRYCGLALHHAKLYDKLRRADEKLKVSLEMLAYHSFCTDEEFEMYYPKDSRLKGQKEKLPQGMADFGFNTVNIEEARGVDRRVHLAVQMFTDLFGLAKFHEETLYRFVITVKKNYRRVPYHNWIHAFTVAHTMYCILKRKNPFHTNERLSLYVSCLVHDLDHRGKSNQFLVQTESPLSNIYHTSQLEHHHFNQTVSILQQEGLNIFSKLESNEYKDLLNNMKSCILATDLNNHFSAKSQLSEILKKSKFSWNILEHRLMAQGVVMTACDLSACAKPWEMHHEIVYKIFEEFYDQGDQEKQKGLEPLPMMDRTKSHLIPKSQVNFLQNICLDCYEMVAHLIPETSPLLNGASSNLVKWTAIAELNKKKPNSQKKNPKKISIFDAIRKFGKSSAS